MSKRSKPASVESFPFTVPIIGLEPRESEEGAPIGGRTGSEPSGPRARIRPRGAGGPSADALHGAQQRMNQRLAVAAAGALLLTITFLRDLVPSPSAGTAWVLLVGWAALAGALASALGSHHLRQRASADHLTQSASPFGALLTAVASVALVVGLACLAAFAYLNGDFA